MKIYIIDFSGANSIKEKISDDIEVFTEMKDGGKAYKEVGEIIPDLILINYDNKPIHGIQTAQAIKQRKKTSNIPILFIGGEQGEIDKIQNLGQAINNEEIDTYIQTTRNTSRYQCIAKSGAEQLR